MPEERDREGEVWTALGPHGDIRSAVWKMRVEDNLRLQAERRHHLEDSARQVPFPLYGLPRDWPGRRFLGGVQRSWPEGVEVIHSMGLLFGTNVVGEGPMLVVETALPDAIPGGNHLRIVAEEWWMGTGRTIDETVEILRGQPASRNLDPWLRPSQFITEIVVDGKTVRLDVVSGNVGNWAGRAQVEGCQLTIEGREFPVEGLELVQVTDLDGYESF